MINIVPEKEIGVVLKLNNPKTYVWADSWFSVLMMVIPNNFRSLLCSVFFWNFREPLWESGLVSPVTCDFLIHVWGRSDFKEAIWSTSKWYPNFALFSLILTWIFFRYLWVFYPIISGTAGYGKKFWMSYTDGVECIVVSTRRLGSTWSYWHKGSIKVEFLVKNVYLVKYKCLRKCLIGTTTGYI